MAEDPNKDKDAAKPAEEKPVLPPSRMREAVDSRGKTSGATVARRQAQDNKKKKKG